MPVKARQFVRKLRGGAQAHLLEAEDGHFYVVKFRNNPQHRRILINEWIASAVIRYLGIATPATAIIELTAEFLEQNPDVHFQFGSRRVPPETGWHFGSRCPGDPARLAVYDFLPDALLERVANIKDFLAIYAVDKWMGNADSRQSIFFRARLRDAGPASGERAGFMAQMVDHGYAFDGPHWSFHDSAAQGLYFRPMVYASVRSIADFQPWLDRIVYFPEEVIDSAFKEIPSAWLEGDGDALEALLEKMLARRRNLPDLIDNSRRSRTTIFPNWS